MANSVDPGQTPQNAASDQGLHCLLGPVCPNSQGKYSRRGREGGQLISHRPSSDLCKH